MVKKFFFLPVVFISLQCIAQQLSIGHLQCEHKSNPLSINSTAPQFGWQLQSTQRNVLQTAYRILVSDQPALTAKKYWQYLGF
jgi:alpha-L-rhamnosidase